MQELNVKRKYYALGELARILQIDYIKLYGLIRRLNGREPSTVTLHTLPLFGRKLFIKTEDASMLQAMIENPEEFAIPVAQPTRPKRPAGIEPMGTLPKLALDH